MDITGIPRRASLEVLRAEAAEELSTVVFERLHNGEDPWAFMEQIPTVDELVVLTLRAELITADGGRIPSLAVELPDAAADRDRLPRTRGDHLVDARRAGAEDRMNTGAGDGQTFLAMIEFGADGAATGHRMVPSTSPQLEVMDLAATRGDGIFETASIGKGHLQAFEPHLRRFAHSAALLELPEPDLDI